MRGCDLHVSFGYRSANPEGASDENLVGKTRGIDVILEDIRILLLKSLPFI